MGINQLTFRSHRIFQMAADYKERADHMNAKTDALNVSCTRCGGNLPVNLAAPIVCPYCGSVDAIEPALLAKIRGVRERYRSRDAALRQFGDRERVFSEKYRKRVIGYLPFLVFFWVLVGLIIGGSAGEMLGHKRTIVSLLVSPPPFTGNESLAWWSLYGGALWLSFSFVLPFLSFFRARRIVVGTRPLPPRAAGEPPRCRNCMYPLPGTGTVRRCPACGSDHLVLDDSYRAEQASLDEAIGAAMGAADHDLAKQVARSENILGSAFLAALLGIFGAPVTGVILGLFLLPAPWLFLFPLAFLAALVTFYFRAWGRIREILKALESGSAGQGSEAVPPGV